MTGLLHGYYLGRATGPFSVELVDGTHDTPAGVVEAARLHERIFRKEATEWVLVQVTALPDLDVTIDEESADICRDLVDGSFPTEIAISGDYGGGGNRTRVSVHPDPPHMQGDHGASTD